MINFKLILIVVQTFVIVVPTQEVRTEVNSKCHQKCLHHLDFEIDSRILEVNCDNNCRAEKCKFGCNIWKEWQSANCSSKCSESFDGAVTQVLRCSVGCHYASNIQFKYLKAQIGKPNAPSLVAGTLNYSSVVLQWEEIDDLNATYLVQCKYVNIPSDWEYCNTRRTNPRMANQVQVYGLEPYTSYRFRVAYVVLPDQEPLLSKESIAIGTIAHGPPSTTPKISTATALGPTRISFTWEPPLFPNGPLLAYILNIQEVENAYESQSKEFSDITESRFHIWNDLKPNTEYQLSIAAQNYIAIGPSSEMKIKTPSKENDLDNVDPYIILAANYRIMKQTLNMFSIPEEIYHSYNSSIKISGLSLHVKQGLIFMSDSNGYVYKMSFEEPTEPTQAIISRSPFSPTVLSVDWLNNQLYLGELNQISRCDLDGKGYAIVISGIDGHPSDIHVDPYNGYLYWVVNSEPNGGIFQVDIASLGKILLHQRDAAQIVKNIPLSAFLVNYKEFSLVYPDEVRNTMFSKPLYGRSSAVDIRANTQSPFFNHIIALASHKDLFYWTDGNDLMGEQYHDVEDKYYHNSFSVIQDHPLSKLTVFHPETQPFPVPLTQATNVQAIFGTQMAKISWVKPQLLQGIGKGAWQDWKYEIWVTDHSLGITIHRTNITDLHSNVYNLKESTKYSIKVLAYSSGGKGPWSNVFTGETFQKQTRNDFPFMLWSSIDGLVKADIVGDRVESLASSSSLQNAVINDISFHDNLLFFTTNTSQLYSYNLQSLSPINHLHKIRSASSLSFDWLGHKIYWSNPEQQAISRCYMDGSKMERLPIMVMARKISVDSVRAFLYWISPHSVECSRLNGDQRIVYFKVGLFSGKQIMGLTLDFDHKKVFWMVRSHKGAFIYEASLAGEEQNLAETVRIVSKLPISHVVGPVWYSSNRLYWLHDDRGIIISDMEGQNVSTIIGYGAIGPKAVAVIDPVLHPYPAGRSAANISVIPNDINESSIRIEGVWSNFNITWKAVENINYGTLHYYILLDSNSDQEAKVTTENTFRFLNARSLRPYSPLHITIQATTLWGSSEKISVKLRSPMSVPSSPLRPRIYLGFNETQDGAIAEFRWSKPLHENGVILGYKVSYWTLSSVHRRISVLQNHVVSPETYSFKILNLGLNKTYNFKVIAYTAVGDGPVALTSIDTSQENHLPQLLLVTSNSVHMTDIDTNLDTTISNRVDDPIDATHLAKEQTVYWMDNIQGISATNLATKKSFKVADLLGKGTSLTVDWIGRFLYWTEKSKNGSSIWKLDLDIHDNNRYLPYHKSEIIKSSNMMSSVTINPFKNELLWIENSHIKVGDVEGKYVHGFFKKDRRRRREATSTSCNCPNNPKVSSMTLNWSEKYHLPRLIWADRGSGHIYSTDYTACHCSIFVNASETIDAGLPPSSISIDQQNIYWSNSSMSKVFMHQRKIMKRSIGPGHEIMSLRRPSPLIKAINAPNVQNIIAIGAYLQSYPEMDCLVPKYNKLPQILNRTSNSIKLLLPHLKIDHERCGYASVATIKYNIYYKQHDGNQAPCKPYQEHPDTPCMRITTHNSIVTIRKLNPYTNYSFQISAVNAYSGVQPHIGPLVVYQTSVGAPSAVGNLTAMAISPYQAKVMWTEPKILLSPAVVYEVHWSTHKSKTDSLGHLESLRKIEFENSKDENYGADIDDLKPGRTYEIKVRVHTSDFKKFTDSDIVVIKTFDLPDNITQVNVSSSHLFLQWTSPNTDNIRQHTLQYKQVSDYDWTNYGFEKTQMASKYDYTLSDLLPKTEYIVRLQIIYKLNNVFNWPQNDEFVFETYGDIPSPPGAPEITAVAKDVYQAEWSQSDSHGGEDLHYVLEAQSVHGNAVNFSDNMWNMVYNGSDKIWIITNLSPSERYIFRVAAVNEYGSSSFSTMPEPFFMPAITVLAQESSSDHIALGSAIAICIVILIIGTIMFFVQRKRLREKGIKQAQIRAIRGPDLELATLRELPNQGNFIHQNNTLYAIDDIPSDEELALLPQIRRDQIVLTKFLGSGAFGEVFEGIAQTIFRSDSDNSRVAVKTLRKGATDQEKAEFLKEAKLMSNFKHEHIISLLGLCLDNDPNFIIIELMEGGDLLSYLRANRPTTFEPITLTLQDVIGISVDVAKGCQYLEEMHFVHRDLAARNCLVSSHDPQQRTVKIGDFGLARDVYKNDYYRKEGEGLLPVRWMAPESLVDGVFTSQSDIWAFGVLLWEVMTLGQQPYPARTNLEVLHYVREGGRLDKPDNCPDDLHQLMLKCWSYNAEERPAFKLCLEILEELKRKSSDAPLTIVHNNHYIGRSFPGGVDNLAYNEDELFHQTTSSTESSFKQNSGESNLSFPLLKRHSDTFSVISDPNRHLNARFGAETVKRAASCDPCSFQHLHVQLPEEPRNRWSAALSGHPDDPPKYLELVQEDSLGLDGYEVPLPAMRNGKTLCSEVAGALKKMGKKPFPPPLNYCDASKSDSNHSIASEHSKNVTTPESADSMMTSSVGSSPLTSAITKFFNSEHQPKSVSTCTDYFSNNSSAGSSPFSAHHQKPNSGISSLSSLSGMSIVDNDFYPDSSVC